MLPSQPQTPVERQETIRAELRHKLVGYIVAALGFVASLAWNEAIKGLIDYIFPVDKNGLAAKIIYAVVISVIVVLVSLWLLRIDRKKKQ